MSPAWAETVRLQLGAQTLHAARQRGWWLPVARQRGWWLHAARQRGGWQGSVQGSGQNHGQAAWPTRADLTAAVAAATRACGARPGQRADWALSSDWVQLHLAAQAAQLQGHAECDAAARHNLQRVHGDAAQAWCVRSARLGDDGLLCAGMDQTLLDALAAATTAAGLRMGHCAPQFTLAWNHLRASMPAHGWLVVLEGARATLLGLVQQRPQVLQTQRLQPQDLAGQLQRWRERCSLQQGLHSEVPNGAPEPDAPCLVLAVGTPPPVVPGATVRSWSWLD